jgi:hypothetical protein
MTTRPRPWYYTVIQILWNYRYANTSRYYSTIAYICMIQQPPTEPEAILSLPQPRPLAYQNGCASNEEHIPAYSLNASTQPQKAQAQCQLLWDYYGAPTFPQQAGPATPVASASTATPLPPHPRHAGPLLPPPILHADKRLSPILAKPNKRHRTKSKTEWIVSTDADYQPKVGKKKKIGKPRDNSEEGGSSRPVQPIGEHRVEVLLHWFKRKSIDSLFRNGSPLVLPSEIQGRWEELVIDEGQGSLELPSNIAHKVNRPLCL